MFKTKFLTFLLRLRAGTVYHVRIQSIYSQRWTCVHRWRRRTDWR
jgi:hypothetical protein